MRPNLLLVNFSFGFLNYYTWLSIHTYHIFFQLWRYSITKNEALQVFVYAPYQDPVKALGSILSKSLRKNLFLVNKEYFLPLEKRRHFIEIFYNISQWSLKDTCQLQSRVFAKAMRIFFAKSRENNSRKYAKFYLVFFFISRPLSLRS